MFTRRTLVGQSTNIASTIIWDPHTVKKFEGTKVCHLRDNQTGWAQVRYMCSYRGVNYVFTRKEGDPYERRRALTWHLVLSQTCTKSWNRQVWSSIPPQTRSKLTQLHRRNGVNHVFTAHDVVNIEWTRALNSTLISSRTLRSSKKQPEKSISRSQNFTILAKCRVWPR